MAKHSIYVPLLALTTLRMGQEIPEQEISNRMRHLEINLTITDSNTLTFSLNIPIFNRYQTSTNVQVNRIGVLNSELDYKQTELKHN